MNNQLSFNRFDRQGIVNEQEIRHYLIMFLIWPFLAFVYALYNYRLPISKTIVFVFFIYYGLTFTIDPYQDSSRYVERFLEYSNQPITYIFQILSVISTSEETFDILEPVISFTVSRFFTDHRALFGAYALVFGFFYLKSINLLYNKYLETENINARVFFIFIALFLPITSIYAPRMWTAAWMFFLGAYQIIILRKPWFFLLTLSACFMHWSYVIVNAVLGIYFIVGNRELIYSILALFSFVAPGSIRSYFSVIASYSGTAVQQRYAGYTGEAYASISQDFASSSSWFMTLNYDLLFYFVLLTILIIRFAYSYLLKDKAIKRFYGFILILLTIVNFGHDIPAFGWRMQMLFILFASSFIFLAFINLKDRFIKPLTLVGIFPMVLYTVINLRIGIETVSAWIILPGFGIPWIADAQSLADFLF